LYARGDGRRRRRRRPGSDHETVCVRRV